MTQSSGQTAKRVLSVLVATLALAVICAAIWWVVPMLITEWAESELQLGVGYIGMFLCLPVGALLGIVSGLWVALSKKGRWWVRMLIVLIVHVAVTAGGTYVFVA